MDKKIEIEKIKKLASLLFEDEWEVRQTKTILWLENKAATISYGECGEKYGLSFNKNANSALIVNLTKFLIENKVKFEVFEDFSIDEEGNIVWESDEAKEAEDSNEIKEGA